MPIAFRRTFPAAALLAGLLAAGCAGHADPPSDAERPVPPVTFSAETERSVCIQLRNDSGAQAALRAPLTAKIRNNKYRIVQECDNAGYVFNIHVLEIRRGDNAGGPVPEEDFPAEDGPVLGLGVGSGMGGRSGVHVGMGFGLAFPAGTRQLPPASASTYTMIAELEIEEAARHARAKQQTQLRVSVSAPSEAAALPRLEEKMAEALSAVLPR